MDQLLHISEEDLQSQQAPKCELLLHIGSQTLQIAVADNNREELRSIAEYQLPAGKSLTEICRMIAGLPEAGRQFRFPFNRIRVAVSGKKFTFIPTELYEPSHLEDYVKFLQAGSEAKVLDKEIRIAGIHNISVLHEAGYAALQELFDRPQVNHQASSFIEGILYYSTQMPQSGSTRLFVDVEAESFQIAAVKEGRLLFYNMFEVANAEEIMYYTLGLCSEFDVQGAELILSGKVEQGDPLHRMLRESFSTVEMAESSVFTKIPDAFVKVPAHRYFSLLSMLRCV